MLYIWNVTLCAHSFVVIFDFDSNSIKVNITLHSNSDCVVGVKLSSFSFLNRYTSDFSRYVFGDLILEYFFFFKFEQFHFDYK